MFYITGEIQVDFFELIDFCQENRTSKRDVLIVYGDGGLNCFDGKSKSQKKYEINGLPIKIFFIPGNQDSHENSFVGYQTKEWMGGTVYFETKYPNIIYAKEGEIYDLAGDKIIAFNDESRLRGNDDSLGKWLTISMPEKGYGLFSKEVWRSEELLPILEAYVK